MEQKNPSIIFLFSGKRKSGKDFISDKLQIRLSEFGSVIIRLSGPIKQEYADNHGLKLEELLSSSDYKETYRKKMIMWSEQIRNKDSGYFIEAALKMYNAESYPLWIISDMRRKTDLQWFQKMFPSIIYPIRIISSEETRKLRGYSFTPGVDDAESECDLDSYNGWKFIIENEGMDQSRINQFIEDITELCRSKIS